MTRTVRTRLTVGWVLLIGLLVLRIPVLLLGQYAPRPWSTVGYLSFMTGTYLLTGLLIWWERDRLAQFHIDGWSLALWCLPAVLIFPIGGNFLTAAAYPVAVAGLAVAFWLKRPRMPEARRATLRWLAVALALGVGYGLLLTVVREWPHLQPHTVDHWTPSLGTLLAQHFTMAAALEEPLFRGFLWGYLKEAGWREPVICVVQAALFFIGHLDPGHHGFMLWQTFAAALLFGWVAWRSRSIATSTVVHGVSNALPNWLAPFLN